ncbi:hypothetical protein FRC00_003062 [Tulasnella sp. 408]|nr:hypothetical protein FRC00_003062 [Tulasnella sp. 408]
MLPGPPPPPPGVLGGLPNAPVSPPIAAKKASGVDSQGMPLPPSPAPTLASKSGTTYLKAAQEKPQLAAAANNQAVTPGALNTAQSSGSNAIGQAAKPAPGGDPFEDAEDYAG